MKFYSALITLLLSQSAFGDEIYNASMNCKRKQFGLHYDCGISDDSIRIYPPKHSVTNLDLLDKLPMRNAISYNLRCVATRALNISLRFGSREFPLMWNSSGSFDNWISSTESDPPVHYALNVISPSPSNAVKECIVDIVSNVSYPSTDYLETVSSLLKSSYEEISNTIIDLDKAQELPASFAALMASKQNILVAIEGIRAETEAFRGELSQTGNSSERRDELNSLIENSLSVTKDLEKAVEDIDGSLSIAEKCNSEEDSSNCVAAVEKIREDLDGMKQSQNESIAKFNQFIDDEISRLQSLANSFSSKLKRLKISQ